MKVNDVGLDHVQTSREGRTHRRILDELVDVGTVRRRDAEDANAVPTVPIDLVRDLPALERADHRDLELVAEPLMEIADVVVDNACGTADRLRRIEHVDDKQAGAWAGQARFYVGDDTLEILGHRQLGIPLECNAARRLAD